MEHHAVLDGITLQYAASVMAGDQDLSKSRLTHLRALEDVAFALCYSHRVVSTQKPPDGPAADVGASLLQALGKENLVEPISQDSRGAPTTLLDEVRSVIEIEDALRNVDEGEVHGANPFLKEWIRREAEEYLGADEKTLSRDALGHEYRFKKSPPYIYDARLQAMVSTRFVRPLREEVLRVAEASVPFPVTEDARDEFVRRCILTHIVISIWYDHMTGDVNLRVPHVTRSLMLRGSAERRRLDRRTRWIRDVRSRHALWDCLRLMPRGGDVLDGILVQRDLGRYDGLRRLVPDLAHAVERGKTGESRRLQHDIERVSGTEYVEPIRFSIRVPLVPVSREISLDALANLSPRRRALRAVRSHADYEAEVHRVLPQLGD